MDTKVPHSANLIRPVRLTAHVPAHLASQVEDYRLAVGLSTGAVVRIALAEFFYRRENGKDRG